MMSADYSRAEFKQALRSLHMTQRSFAALVGLSEVTVNQWATYTPMPRWVPLLLSAMAECQALREAAEGPSEGC